MFTGLIETKSKLLSHEKCNAGRRLLIASPFDDISIGESISVNGVCLTVLPDISQGLMFDVSPETLRVTTLSAIQPGADVNLERAMMASSRFGGHWVSGHVDCTALIQDVTKQGEFMELSIGPFSEHVMSYLIEKGSIAIDGVSLTINKVHNSNICVQLVPHTQWVTICGQYALSDVVNVEFDSMTKLIDRQVRAIVNQLLHER